MCDQSIEDFAASCSFCGHVFDKKRAAAEDAARAARAVRAEAVVRKSEPRSSAAGQARARTGTATSVEPGAVLAEAFGAWGANFVPFVLTCMVVVLPVAGANAYLRTLLPAQSRHMASDDAMLRIAI